MLSTRTLTLSSPVDGLSLSLLEIAPDQPPKGLVQLLHGMLEYKERYIGVMQRLAEAGYVCVISDHRGHGKSVRSPEDLGYLYTTDSSALARDAHAVADFFRARYPGLPYFVLGHSMGSMAALDFLRRYPAEPDGVLLSGCPTDNPMKAAGLLLCRVLSALYGQRHRSKLMLKLTLGPFVRAFPNEKSPMCWISSDPAQVRAQEENPLSHFNFTLTGYQVLLGLMNNVFTPRRWPKGRPVPVLFFSGENDPCMGNAKKLSAAAKLVASAGFGTPDVRLYPVARHEVLFDPASREQAIGGVIEFLNAHISS